MVSSDNLIKTCTIGSGIRADVVDATIHYFGGYYHVIIRISADVPVARSAFDSDEDYRDALGRLGGTVRFSRDLEKMAVPEGELAAVRGHLIDSFDTNVLMYLSREDFADSFVRSEYRKLLQKAPATFR